MPLTAILLHIPRMKRARVVLDAALLKDVLRLSGERTYARAVERALSDFVRRAARDRDYELLVPISNLGSRGT